MRFTFDIESTGLLDESSIDYTSSPYKVRDNFNIHCLVFQNQSTKEIIAFYDGPTYIFDGRRYEEGEYVLENYEPLVYTHHQKSEVKEWIRSNVTEVVGHNIINFDLLACHVAMDMPYCIDPDTWCEKEILIEDTLVVSKTLNPDRFNGHSLDAWGERVGKDKIQFRKHIPADNRFKTFAADMLYYCIRDVEVNTLVDKALHKEAGDWDWAEAISIEKMVMYIVTHQQHRGFKFNSDLAIANIEELDRFMAERKAKVDPIVPPKQMTKGRMSDYIPPAKQFKKNLEPSAHMIKFAAKHGWILEEKDSEWYMNGLKLPLPPEPLVTEETATIDDTTHIKGWLCSLGWEPTEWAERDITVKTNKTKKSPEEIQEAMDKYVEQCETGPFGKLRMEQLEVNSIKELRIKLEKQVTKSKPMKLPHNPKFTVGQEKEVCPNLAALHDKFPYAKDIVEYLTHRHRRNSILGGMIDWEEYNEEDDYKGLLPSVREDGRIPTPADTCGASTSRMKHKVVVNVPRSTSLYGAQMREMFGVDTNYCWQFAFDFASLEARMEGHYCYRWEADKAKPYCNSLLLEKPLDVHSSVARKISELLGREFSRANAKAVKYGTTYGAQAPKVAKIIGSDMATGQRVFDAFWEAAAPLAKLKEALTLYWETTGQKKFVLGIDGRKIPTRSKHSLVNALFQSAGVICAKKVMILHYQKLKVNGLTVDFFKEDWKSKTYCQQLIAMHDEQQMEASKKLIKFKIFKEEAEAKEYQKQTPCSSAIGHSTKGYYVATSIVAELLQQAVDETTAYFKLKVPLAIEWQAGRSWRECH